MRGRTSRRLLSVAFLAAFATPLLATSASSAASTHGLRVLTQFQPPAPGQIDVIAVTFSARFTGKAAPPHPITKVSLPGASRPHNYGLLYGTKLTKVSGHVATYLWLTLALKPLGARASHDQPLVGDTQSLTSVTNGDGLQNTAEALVINNDDEAERVQFSTWLREDGTLAFSVYDPHHVTTYNDFNWDLNPLPSSAGLVWNKVVSVAQDPQQNVAATVQAIDAILHANFLSGAATPAGTGSGAPTVTGSLTTGTQSGTVDYVLNPSSAVNAFRLVDTKGGTISSHFVHGGWSCSNTSADTVVCKGPLISTGFTGILSSAGSAAPKISVAGSSNGGFTFGPASVLTLPTSPTSQTPGSGTLRLTCPTSVTQSQSIQITIDVGTPSAPVKVTWTLPSGSTVSHTAIPNATDPTTEHDAIGTSQAGPWNVVAASAGQTATCPTITVNPG